MKWLRIFLNYASKAILVAAPLVAPLKTLPLLGWMADESSRALASVALLGLVFVIEARDLYSVTVGVDEFLEGYVKGQAFGIKKHWGTDLRLNVMYLRRAWWTLFLFRVFEWRARKGFDQPGTLFRDHSMILFSFQGVAGQAKNGDPKFVETLPQKWELRFWRILWMFPWQVQKTAHLRAILSVPMVREARGRRVVVGVLNLDAISAAGAEYLRENVARLTKDLAETGKHFACLP